MIRISKLQKQILGEFVSIIKEQGTAKCSLDELKKTMEEKHEKQPSSVGRSCVTLAKNGYLIRHVDSLTLNVSYEVTKLGEKIGADFCTD
ncbi:hypothetical protein [Vibrio rotiferianus]|uniref:hypothetical protein n=1 Tax=Vibrio rotiferianus TaxID=190895 RepID=UPI0005F0A298|nr:hypothetical protein [Vibrio rotiferianus]